MNAADTREQDRHGFVAYMTRLVIPNVGALTHSRYIVPNCVVVVDIVGDCF
jgi:hypothetical protein